MLKLDTLLSSCKSTLANCAISFESVSTSPTSSTASDLITPTTNASTQSDSAPTLSATLAAANSPSSPPPSPSSLRTRHALLAPLSSTSLSSSRSRFSSSNLPLHLRRHTISGAPASTSPSPHFTTEAKKLKHKAVERVKLGLEGRSRRRSSSVPLPLHCTGHRRPLSPLVPTLVTAEVPSRAGPHIEVDPTGKTGRRRAATTSGLSSASPCGITHHQSGSCARVPNEGLDRITDGVNCVEVGKLELENVKNSVPDLLIVKLKDEESMTLTVPANLDSSSSSFSHPRSLPPPPFLLSTLLTEPSSSRATEASAHSLATSLLLPSPAPASHPPSNIHKSTPPTPSPAVSALSSMVDAALAVCSASDGSSITVRGSCPSLDASPVGKKRTPDPPHTAVHPDDCEDGATTMNGVEELIEGQFLDDEMDNFDDLDTDTDFEFDDDDTVSNNAVASPNATSSHPSTIASPLTKKEIAPTPSSRRDYVQPYVAFQAAVYHTIMVCSWPFSWVKRSGSGSSKVSGAQVVQDTVNDERPVNGVGSVVETGRKEEGQNTSSTISHESAELPTPSGVAGEGPRSDSAASLSEPDLISSAHSPEPTAAPSTPTPKSSISPLGSAEVETSSTSTSFETSSESASLPDPCSSTANPLLPTPIPIPALPPHRQDLQKQDLKLMLRIGRALVRMGFGKRVFPASKLGTDVLSAAGEEELLGLGSVGEAKSASGKAEDGGANDFAQDMEGVVDGDEEEGEWEDEEETGGESSSQENAVGGEEKLVAESDKWRVSTATPSSSGLPPPTTESEPASNSATSANPASSPELISPASPSSPPNTNLNPKLKSKCKSKPRSKPRTRPKCRAPRPNVTLRTPEGEATSAYVEDTIGLPYKSVTHLVGTMAGRGRSCFAANEWGGGASRGKRKGGNAWSEGWRNEVERAREEGGEMRAKDDKWKEKGKETNRHTNSPPKPTPNGHHRAWRLKRNSREREISDFRAGHHDWHHYVRETVEEVVYVTGGGTFCARGVIEDGGDGGEGSAADSFNPNFALLRASNSNPIFPPFVFQYQYGYGVEGNAAYSHFFTQPYIRSPLVRYPVTTPQSLIRDEEERLRRRERLRLCAGEDFSEKDEPAAISGRMKEAIRRVACPAGNSEGKARRHGDENTTTQDVGTPSKRTRKLQEMFQKFGYNLDMKPLPIGVPERLLNSENGASTMKNSAFSCPGSGLGIPPPLTRNLVNVCVGLDHHNISQGGSELAETNERGSYGRAKGDSVTNPLHPSSSNFVMPCSILPPPSSVSAKGSLTSQATSPALPSTFNPNSTPIMPSRSATKVPMIRPDIRTVNERDPSNPQFIDPVYLCSPESIPWIRATREHRKARVRDTPARPGSPTPEHVHNRVCARPSGVDGSPPSTTRLGIRFET